ncbi:uncharacterized protein LOC100932997 [Sarcophilus harrisii]|uniref:uncharacterized protein LOC100932997 n=1 Tax=Sarcophilus harrisii TaxID=9305 RepID=UPI0013020C15|nr:uncharacterized protein LOC100932997 [Sarcophilus harrisii]
MSGSQLTEPSFLRESQVLEPEGTSEISHLTPSFYSSGDGPREKESPEFTPSSTAGLPAPTPRCPLASLLRGAPKLSPWPPAPRCLRRPAPMGSFPSTWENGTLWTISTQWNPLMVLS